MEKDNVRYRELYDKYLELERSRDAFCGKWGFNDEAGKNVIQPNYNHVFPFVNAMAKVRIGRKNAYLDKSGQEIVPFNYDIIASALVSTLSKQIDH